MLTTTNDDEDDDDDDDFKWKFKYFLTALISIIEEGKKNASSSLSLSPTIVISTSQS